MRYFNLLNRASLHFLHFLPKRLNANKRCKHGTSHDGDGGNDVLHSQAPF